MAKKYKIETINDMMEIPMERFPIFLNGLPTILMMARTTHEFNRLRGMKGPVMPKPMVWIDDDKGEINTKIIFQTKKEEKKEER
ncbi:MAG: hypothetical protein O8C67_15260 [Candidatus Methanoperedens sp.]|nr:hypothetical protein [Candidatus Methanoperedens sp.]